MSFLDYLGGIQDTTLPPPVSDVRPLNEAINTSSASTVPETVNTSSASELRGDLDFSDAESDLDLIGTDSIAYQLEQQRKYNEQQAEIAYQRQREFRKTYYADLVEGMKAAGLNPMLLSHVGYSGSTVPQASSQAIGGDTWSDLVNASASKHNSYSQRLSSIAAMIGASASVLSAVADFLPTSAAPVKRAVGFQVK